VYQFASVTRWGRNTGQAPQGQLDPESPTVVLTAANPASGRRSADRYWLGALDIAAVVAVSLLVGATPAALTVRAATTVMALAVVGLYRPRLRYSVLDDLPRMVLAVAPVSVIAGWLGQPTGWQTPSWQTMSWLWQAAIGRAAIGQATIGQPPAGRAGVLSAVLLGASLLGGVVVTRVFGYRALGWRRRRSPGRPTLVVGSGDLALRLAAALRTDRGYGLAPIGIVGHPPLTPTNLAAPVLGGAADLVALVERYRPEYVIVAFPGGADADLVDPLRRCRHRGVTILVVPRLFELSLGRTGAELVHGVPLVRLRPEPTQLRRWALKRIVDIVGAAIGLLVLSPVLTVCALAVCCESGRRGVLFHQDRIGRYGRPFTIMKFRSLTPSSDRESQVRWNISTDARVGPVGRLLRTSSLDELPQLFNVLRGDMSLVGPRPERAFFVERFQRTYAGYADRHRVPVGITGWAQVHGLRGDTSIADRVRFDNYYAENWSLGLDVKIILRTVGSMFSIHRL
jgi:exopolysaccharide biosynthesis polyprenyl glycosylphosphotransferase